METANCVAVCAAARGPRPCRSPTSSQGMAVTCKSYSVAFKLMRPLLLLNAFPLCPLFASVSHPLPPSHLTSSFIATAKSSNGEGPFPCSFVLSTPTYPTCVFLPFIVCLCILSSTLCSPPSLHGCVIFLLCYPLSCPQLLRPANRIADFPSESSASLSQHTEPILHPSGLSFTMCKACLFC